MIGLEAWIPAGLAALAGIVWTKGLEGRIDVHASKIEALEKNGTEIKNTVAAIYELLLKEPNGRHGQR
jgi:hypothetical protein